MRNNTFLFWVLLLVEGVFGSDKVISVLVMEGDSVTLRTDLTGILGDSKIIWKYGDENIAKIHYGTTSFSHSDERFRDRLTLDKQTGSLSITNIRTEHAGNYSVDVMTTTAHLTTFIVTVHDNVESVPVMQGDSVTLHTGVSDIQRDDQILWKFGDQVIPTDRLNAAVDERWRNIDLNAQTREITIRNIRIDQSGDYKMEFNSIRMILHKKFSVTVGGGVKTVSVKEGESVILHTSVTEIQGYDLILWKKEDYLVAEFNQQTKLFLRYDRNNRFNGRLQQFPQSGSLIISDSETTDSGVYHLNMSSSSHDLQRTIRVTVKNSGSSAAVSGMCGASFGLLVWAVTVLLLQEV